MFDTSKNSLWRHVVHPRQRVAAIRSAAKRTAAAGLLIALLVPLTGCVATGEKDDGRLRIYATTGYLADAVRNIAPDAAVTTMVGPGSDPHTYQPSTRDIERILDADLVLWNGLNLEAQMVDQLSSLGDRQLAVGDQLPRELLLSWPQLDHDGNPLFDPHIWNSPEAWARVVETVADRIAELDPARANSYLANASGYIAEIDRAAATAADRLAEVPEPRVLVTGHDAFNYFGASFDLEVRATDFISTEAALDAESLSELARFIAEERVPTVFQDNQANPQAISSLREAVRARGWEVRISGAELYADALGAEPGVDTYLGVFLHNVDAIASALKEDVND